MEHGSAMTRCFAALAAAWLTCAWAAPARANLDLDEMAAALALPVVTAQHFGFWEQESWVSQAQTIISVTNGSSRQINLHINVISGDEGDDWRSDSFDCPVTARETVLFYIEAYNEYVSRLEYECDTVNNTPADESSKSRFLLARTGVFWVAVEDPIGESRGQNYIFGDAVVIDQTAGTAYSVGAIPFQGRDANNNGDRAYKFDGKEYDSFPHAVATNFLAPTWDIDAELILFTLDGTVGLVPAPNAKVDVIGYNDDEEPFNTEFSFECFAIVKLLEISPNFLASQPGSPGLGSPGGHLQLTPRASGTDEHDAHDAKWGDNDSIRRRPIHGWLVQTFLWQGGNPEDASTAPQPTCSATGAAALCTSCECPKPPAPAPAADIFAQAARPLAQSRLNHTGEPGDPTAVLDARTQ